MDQELVVVLVVMEVVGAQFDVSQSRAAHGFSRSREERGPWMHYEPAVPSPT